MAKIVISVENSRIVTATNQECSKSLLAHLFHLKSCPRRTNGPITNCNNSGCNSAHSVKRISQRVTDTTMIEACLCRAVKRMKENNRAEQVLHWSYHNRRHSPVIRKELTRRAVSFWSPTSSMKRGSGQTAQRENQCHRWLVSSIKVINYREIHSLRDRGGTSRHSFWFPFSVFINLSCQLLREPRVFKQKMRASWWEMCIKNITDLLCFARQKSTHVCNCSLFQNAVYKV